jgi:hypothetical protein
LERIFAGFKSCQNYSRRHAAFLSASEFHMNELGTHIATLEVTTSATCNLQLRVPFKHAAGLETTLQAATNVMTQNTRTSLATMKQAAWILNSGGRTTPTGSLYTAATAWRMM